MKRLRVFLFRLRNLFRKRELEQQLADEIQSHLEMQADEYLRQGMSPTDARHLALRKFGGVEQIKETYRDRRGLPGVETFLRDLGYGLRMLRRSPGVTTVAILSLALGIGANTALFSVVDAVMLKTLPVEQPDRLVVFEWQAGRQYRTTGMSGTSNVDAPPGFRGLSLFRYDVFEKLHEAQAAASQSPLSDLFAFGPLPELTVKRGNQAEVINGQAVSGNYYQGLRVNPILGRLITIEDDTPGAPPVVVISYQYWQERLNADATVVGQQLKLNQQSFTIIGVTPPAFNGTLQVGYYPAVTVPLSSEPLVDAENSRLGTPAQPGVWWLNLMGRLNPGATYEQARETLNRTFQEAALAAMPAPRNSSEAAQLEQKNFPRLISEPGSRGMLDKRKSYAPTIYGLFIVVGLVLLVACANLANLLLARATTRASEITVRLALGAGRWRLIRQLLTESLLLSILGGSVGVLFAFWARGALAALTNNEQGLFPSGIDFGLNWRVLTFTFVISLLTGLLFGLVPAWRVTNVGLSRNLNQSGRMTSGVSRLSKILLVAQVSISALLLVGAGLFIRTLQNLERVKLGFNQGNLLVFRLQPERAGYKGDRLVRFYQQLFERLDHLPGVSAATFARVELIANENWFNDFLLPGETVAPATDRDTMRQAIRENYFATMQIPFLRGRGFSAKDDQHSPLVGIVNEQFAREFFPNEDVLGKRITLMDKKREIEIVGVVADAKYQSQREETKPLLYTPWRQEVAEIGDMHFALRATSDSAVLAAQVREVVRQVDNNLPVTEIGTQSARAQTTLGQERLYARLFTFFGVLASLLAGIGLFGMLAYSVSQRTREIGIRMAFGAQMKNVVLLIIWQGMRLVLAGLGIGALTVYVLKRLLEHQYFGPDSWQRQMTEQLFGVSVSDPLTLLAIASLLTLVALLACWIPAHRAAKVDPLVALRYE